jgi:HD-GYP domain-containing protein (c-di-GMP phosphodiesterase class II)
VAREVALNHHERWDGTGYPGHVESLKAVPEKAAPGKRGKEIPLSARIVAIADVYDALISERIYKEAWEEQRALAYLDDEAGRQFDPELVSLFLDMQDIVGSIRRKYAF